MDLKVCNYDIYTLKTHVRWYTVLMSQFKGKLFFRKVMYMNILLKKQIVLIALTFTNIQLLASVSYIARWKNNVEAAYTVTIDDNGPTGMREHQASVLEEYDLRGTFNVITRWFPYDVTRQQYWNGIYMRGHEIASHSENHIALNGLDIEVIQSELFNSKSQIESITSAACISFAAPYGSLDAIVQSQAKNYYLSARGTGQGVNLMESIDELYDLKIAPYPGPWGATWANDQYILNLETYILNVIESRGYGIDMFHDLAENPEDVSSGPYLDESVFRAHLLDLSEKYQDRLWVAPQGQVAKYFIERKNSTIVTRSITDNVIIVELLFDGDLEIFNEPLTVITDIPSHFLHDNLVIMQNGSQLDYKMGTYDIVPDFVDNIRISGNISPDATDIYTKLPEDYKGKPAYKANDKEFYIWYNDHDSTYYLSSILGSFGSACWNSLLGAVPYGSYGAHMTGTVGTPKASFIPEKVFGVKYDVLPGTGTICIVLNPILGDLNNDGYVDLTDLSILSSNWLKSVR